MVETFEVGNDARASLVMEMQLRSARVGKRYCTDTRDPYAEFVGNGLDSPALCGICAETKLIIVASRERAKALNVRRLRSKQR
jgi:hypothetical protein